MPLGSAVTTTIDIDFTRAQGVNSSGRISFQPSRQRIGTTMISTYRVLVEVEEGIGEVDLVRLPAGTYHVREEIDGRPPYEFDFALPLGAAALIQYEEIAQVSPVPPTYTAVRTVNGVPPDPTTGNIEVAGGGGPSTLDGLSDVTIVSPANGQAVVYDSVDSRWENRALTASDVGASATGHTHIIANVTGLQAALDLKAASAHTHNTSDITGFQAAVDARVQLIVDAAPAALDTLNELAAAIGDDANFAGTVTTSLAAQQAALDTKANAADAILKALLDAKGDLIAGSADNTPVRVPVGADGLVLTADSAQASGLAWTELAAGGGADPGDDILALYGHHSVTSHISSFRSEFGQSDEIWIARVCVRAGRAVEKISTFVKTAGVLGAGGVNGFAIASDDGTQLLFSAQDNNLWASAGLVSVNLGGSAIPAQPVDRYYRVQLSVQGYTTPPIMMLNQGDHAVLSEHEKRARFANASAGFQGGGGYNPLTFGTSTGGFYPLIMLGGSVATGDDGVAPLLPVTLTDAATIAVDASLGNHFRVTLGGNRILGNPTNPIDGQKILLEVIQDGTGSRALSLTEIGSVYAFGTDIPSITLSTAINKRDFVALVYNSTAAKWFVIAFNKGF